ncbi:hypothetical protein BGX38DRAFT_1145710 [Terfezia claveryi]|nr:hypothetical protein BGX38DRAFT_1145710 [Terfezia claveryi]
MLALLSQLMWTTSFLQTKDLIELIEDVTESNLGFHDSGEKSTQPLEKRWEQNCERERAFHSSIGIVFHLFLVCDHDIITPVSGESPCEQDRFTIITMRGMRILEAGG